MNIHTSWLFKNPTEGKDFFSLGVHSSMIKLLRKGYYSNSGISAIFIFYSPPLH